MLELIKLWLNSNRNYLEGVVILSKFCDNKPLLGVMRSENNRNKKRLEEMMWEQYELLKKDVKPISSNVNIIASNANKVAPVANKLILPVNKNIPEVVKEDFKSSPVYIAAKLAADKEYREVMSDRAVLFHQAKPESWEDVNTPDKVSARSELAVKVATGYNRASKLYQKADHVLATGQLPDAELSNENDYELLPDHMVDKTISNIRKNLSKLRKREQTPERLELIKKHEENLKKLEIRCSTLK